MPSILRVMTCRNLDDLLKPEFHHRHAFYHIMTLSAFSHYDVSALLKFRGIDPTAAEVEVLSDALARGLSLEKVTDLITLFGDSGADADSVR